MHEQFSFQMEIMTPSLCFEILLPKHRFPRYAESLHRIFSWSHVALSARLCPVIEQASGRKSAVLGADSFCFDANFRLHTEREAFVHI